jgi:nucleotide-binding universal stress UspA family protein
MGRFSTALQDFRRARRRAAMQELLERLGARPQRLLSFDEVRRHLGEHAQSSRGMREIPLESIVGSVGRYEDFNRQFLPRQEIQAGRWARVRMAFEFQGTPPIEVYKIGEAYFVSDGHHRVSVARQLGAKTIEAYITEIPTRAPISPEDDVDDLILKVERAKFLEQTSLDKRRPDVELAPTCAGCYAELLDHISVHRYFMGQEQAREISFEEGVEHWLENVYLPAVEAIQQLGLLKDFTDRSEADMYLWLMRHRAELAAQLGWDLDAREAAASLWNITGWRPRRLWQRLIRGLRRMIPIKALRPRPLAVEWRLARGELGEGETLFPRLLVPISGEDSSWNAVDQALFLAEREHSEIRGVHVLGPREREDSQQVAWIREEFDRRVHEAGLKGKLVIEHGNIHRQVAERSHWSDLVILHLKHPPGDQPMQRLMSGLRAFLQETRRPVLVLSEFRAMRHGLLAYDDSRRAQEALYLAAYTARHWQVKLTVLTVGEQGNRQLDIQNKARAYLEAQHVKAEFVQRVGKAGGKIHEVATRQNCDFILMGGYAGGPLVEVAFGSTVDYVLREFSGPIFICR